VERSYQPHLITSSIVPNYLVVADLASGLSKSD